MNEQYALITGASSGIGAAFALELAQHGHDLILVARRLERLDKLAEKIRRDFGRVVHVIALDLSNQEAISTLERILDERRLVVDILINNAGNFVFGRFADQQKGIAQSMIGVHIQSLTELTHLVLPGMVARGRGKVLNVTSTIVYGAGVYMAVYTACKSYVLSFSNSLADELSDSGVTVTALCPGTTESEINARGVGWWNQKRIMSAEAVARIGYHGCMLGQRTVIPGFLNQAVVWILWLLPSRFVTFMYKKKRNFGKA